jgi:hypothetical protein
MEASHLMTRHRVMQELRHSESFASRVLPPVLAQKHEVLKPEVPRVEDSHWIEEDRCQQISHSKRYRVSSK